MSEKRYEAQRLHAYPIGTDTAYGVWDFQNAAFIRFDGRTWSSWDAAKAVITAARLNAGKGIE